MLRWVFDSVLHHRKHAAPIKYTAALPALSSAIDTTAVNAVDVQEHTQRHMHEPEHSHLLWFHGWWPLPRCWPYHMLQGLYHVKRADNAAAVSAIFMRELSERHMHEPEHTHVLWIHC